MAKPILRPDGIGARLQEERLRLGYSQTDFGEMCGVKKVAVYNYERGERHPDSLFFAAADRVGADILYVVTGRRASPAPLQQLTVDFKRKIEAAVVEAVQKALREVTHVE